MIRIVTDSSCDIDIEKANEMGIDIMPIQVHFGEESFRAGLDITTDEFYEKLKSVDKLPTTSQITPIQIEEKFREILDAGDEIVALFISKEMSGTHHNALMAKNMIGSDKIHIIDTKQTTFALALLLIETVKLRERGFSAAEISSKITELVPRVKLLASIETLKYLKMGGRLSSTSALIGGILGIYPIITLSEGKVETVGKARGRAAANKSIKDMVIRDGISSDYAITFGHSAALEACKNFEKYISDITGKKQYMRCNIGCIVGTHTGPGDVGIAYIKK